MCKNEYSLTVNFLEDKSLNPDWDKIGVYLLRLRLKLLLRGDLRTEGATIEDSETPRGRTETTALQPSSC